MIFFVLSWSCLAGITTGTEILIQFIGKRHDHFLDHAFLYFWVQAAMMTYLLNQDQLASVGRKSFVHFHKYVISMQRSSIFCQLCRIL
jgi:thiamine pyrophosphokinase